MEMTIKRLLAVRRRQKSRMPEFKRWCWNRKLRLRYKSWRKPRGLDNKLRKRYGGKWSQRVTVNIGFGSPRAVRYLHPSGFKDVLVHNLKELEGLNPKEHAVRISSRVGLKKRLEIEEKAKELGFKVLNPTHSR